MRQRWRPATHGHLCDRVVRNRSRDFHNMGTCRAKTINGVSLVQLLVATAGASHHLVVGLGGAGYLVVDVEVLMGNLGGVRADNGGEGCCTAGTVDSVEVVAELGIVETVGGLG